MLPGYCVREFSQECGGSLVDGCPLTVHDPLLSLYGILQDGLGILYTQRAAFDEKKKELLRDQRPQVPLLLRLPVTSLSSCRPPPELASNEKGVGKVLDRSKWRRMTVRAFLVEYERMPEPFRQCRSAIPLDWQAAAFFRPVWGECRHDDS